MTVIIIHKSQLILAILILATQGSLAKFAAIFSQGHIDYAL